MIDSKDNEILRNYQVTEDMGESPLIFQCVNTREIRPYNYLRRNPGRYRRDFGSVVVCKMPACTMTGEITCKTTCYAFSKRKT